jgi:GAF domain-containing protein
MLHRKAEERRLRDELAADAIRAGDNQRLRAILEEVCEITGMGFAAVARVTEQRWIACQVLDRIEFGMEPGDELKIMTTICNDIRECGEAIIIDSVGDNPHWKTHAAPMLYGFESYASLPLYTRDGEFFGTLCAIDPTRHDLTGAAMVVALQEYAREVEVILAI